MLQRYIKTALIQMCVVLKKSDNLIRAEELILEAAKNGAELICLPECFNCPYGPKYFRENAESIRNGPTVEMLSRVSRKCSIYLVGGSIPTLGQDRKMYNTLTVWNPEGNLIAKYNKMHLYDTLGPGEEFLESDYFTKGDKLATFLIDKINLKIGLGVCYDLMFEELSRLYSLKGCEMLIFPSAFSMYMGSIYFELVQRSRAADNQCFVLGVNEATGNKGHISWGHSQITGPMGNILAKASHSETIIYGCLYFDECRKVRQLLPIVNQRRTDIYDIGEKENILNNI